MCLFEHDVAVYRLSATVEMSYDSRLIRMYTYSNSEGPIVCKCEQTRREGDNDVGVSGTVIIQVGIRNERKKINLISFYL